MLPPRIAQIPCPRGEAQSIGSARIISKCITSKPGGIVTDFALLYNCSDFPWSTNPSSPIYLSYHLRSIDGKHIMYNGIRTPIKNTVLPGCLDICAINIEMPMKLGEYYLEVTLVHEGKAWLEDLGLKRWITHLCVSGEKQSPQDEQVILTPRAHQILTTLKQSLASLNQGNVQ
jgi:hypothetical protein